jgi:hypothetical protein
VGATPDNNLARREENILFPTKPNLGELLAEFFFAEVKLATESSKVCH